MAVDSIGSNVKLEDGLWTGGFRRPPNFAETVEDGNIHDDAQAKRIGFDGGFVSGLILMDLYPPVLVKVFGDSWFTNGTWANYFRQPTFAGDEVRVRATQAPADARDALIETSLEDRSGAQRVVGNAGIGNPSGKTLVRQRFEASPPPGQLRMLHNTKVGMVLEPHRKRVSTEQQRARKDEMPEPIDWYWDKSPWGGPICSPWSIAWLMVLPLEFRKGLVEGDPTGAMGGIETRIIDGPIFTDRDYLSTSRLLAVGESAQTEYLWFESKLTEADTGKPVAEQLFMRRWIKAASSAYR